MTLDLKNAPYYDTINEELDKNYTKILFTSGKAIQNRELNEIGSYAAEHTKKIANLLYKDGTIISGCSIQNIDVTTSTITLTEGKVFVDGEIFDIIFERPNGPFGENVPVNANLVSRTIPVKITGNETIFVKL